MTNEEIWRIAREQSAIDLSCMPEDFLTGENKVVISQKSSAARRYLELPFFSNLVSYGKNIVASVDECVADFTLRYLNRYSPEHCFETPNIHILIAEYQKYGKTPCFMAEYFLPDLRVFQVLPCRYPVRILHPADFTGLYVPQWSNALCEKRRQLDMLAAAAFDGSKMIGMAGCSADCETMWQIGIDVLPEYRGQGIASALTSRLAEEAMKRGKVPFYCAAWSNIGSKRNAIKSGFRTAWTELTSIDANRVRDMLHCEEVNKM